MIWPDDCKLAVSTDAVLTEDSDSGFADNKYSFNLVLFWMTVGLQQALMQGSQ